MFAEIPSANNPPQGGEQSKSIAYVWPLSHSPVWLHDRPKDIRLALTMGPGCARQKRAHDHLPGFSSCPGERGQPVDAPREITARLARDNP
jgi:hypothetical protein